MRFYYNSDVSTHSEYIETVSLISKTLPVVMKDALILDQAEARSFGQALSETYKSATPFRHIALEDFLPTDVAETIHEAFPTESLPDDVIHDTGYGGLRKRGVNPESCVNKVKQTFYFFNSPPFLQFLEALTGIDGLIGDPYFHGGGFHEIFNGGKLGIHADFRIHQTLNLQRRINVLIYLNKDWSTEFGGELELWDASRKQKITSFAPVFNRCVIFNTDADSYHGHPDPLQLPPERSRRSLALYYYTASHTIHEDIPNLNTRYVARPSDNSSIRKQVWKLQLHNWAREWVPPIAYRRLIKLKRALKSR